MCVKNKRITHNLLKLRVGLYENKLVLELIRKDIR